MVPNICQRNNVISAEVGFRRMIYPAGIEVKRHILASEISFANLFLASV
jgi:hypothetical protein